MKIKSVKVKNILSYGNKWTQIILDNQLNNLIVGENGTGKSTVVTDAIFYALSGKPYRDIKKTELINQKNKKNLIVELDIEQNKHNYKIVRGQKPEIFKIYRDNELIEESAKTADYQKLLERILQFDLKVFKNTVIISSSFYTPFLRLKTPEKRVFIEKILNIEIFSDMRDKLKIKNSVLKQNILTNEKDIERVSSNINLINELNSKKEVENKQELRELEIEFGINSEDINNNHKERIKSAEIDYQKSLSEIDNSVNIKEQLEIEKKQVLSRTKTSFENKKTELNHEFTETIEKIEKIEKIEFKELKENISLLENNLKLYNNSLGEIKVEKVDLEHEIIEIEEKCSQYELYKKKLWQIGEKITSIYTEQDFFNSNRNCPQCKQEITDDYVTEIKNEFEKKLKKLESSKKKGQQALTKIEKLLEKVSTKKQNLKSSINKIRDIETKITNYNHDIEIKNVEIVNFEEKFKTTIDDKKSLLELSLKTLEEKYNDKIKSINDMYIEKNENVKNKEKLKDELKIKHKKEIKHITDSKNQILLHVEENYKKIKNKLENIVYEATDIKQIELKEYENEKISFSDTQRQYKAITHILSDKGIKTYIIRKFVPVLNQFVNHYLDILNAKYRLMFDENLNEKIALSGYENLSYHSFSTGEKQRVDLALLFSFLKLAKIKESGASTNLLILDEIADSGMDENGISGLVSILNDLKISGYTSFTISHRDIRDQFDKVFTVVKKQYSEIQEAN